MYYPPSLFSQFLIHITKTQNDRILFRYVFFIYMPKIIGCSLRIVNGYGKGYFLLLLLLEGDFNLKYTKNILGSMMDFFKLGVKF